ncbi:deoxyribodipyrimidine photo-lyase [Maridesulfovibrio sp. FT414]|uniref:deoxyribodipyrimidine photo-lyase n=1 Tax=Maridesulfovibrio sp. FT414 TaxID=2979469 RepID=UPI003D804DCE
MGAVDQKRIYSLNHGKDTGGPVIYWMGREQRVQDNWGLLHARSLAGDSREVRVVFCLVPSYLGATLRHYDFMLKGLEQVEAGLAKLGIPFTLKLGLPDRELPLLVKELGAGIVVSDFDPLRVRRGWHAAVGREIDVPLVEVDGHNVVPARFVTDKLEYAARTIRPKIQRLLPEFLTSFPKLKGMPGSRVVDPAVDWKSVREFIDVDCSVGPVDLEPGEAAGRRALDEFVARRLKGYGTGRNDPNAGATSGLSPYFHFGQLAPQRAALEVAFSGVGEDQQAYLEELIIRRELSDNFCLHTPEYDSLEGAPEWARRVLDECSGDVRAYLYSYDDFEKAQTHSALWNAAQNQLVVSGRMHGYMRMYWAKKILEWSASPAEALRTANALNDRFALDGRDPNGYVGTLWSVAGLHDRPWKRRPVFGSIRYMNEKGCRRKFDVDMYVKKWGQ